jgi:hypothetical protein
MTIRTIIILCLSISSLVSCGKLSEKRPFEQPVNRGNIAGLEEPVQHNLSLSELKIAQRICTSLKSKRAYLEAALTATPPKAVAYTFALENKNCQDKLIEKKNIYSKVELISNDLEFSTNDSSNYFIDVITDKSTALAQICTEIFNTKTPTLEEKVISNADIILNKLYFVTLTTNDQKFDTIQINTKIANTSGGYDSLNAQLISVFTDASQVVNVKDVGVEKERSQYKKCDGNAFTTQKQTFVRSAFL